MTQHALELISARRDESLDPAADLFLADHLRACADCRAFARDVELTDRALRIAEPHVVVPPRRMPTVDSLRRHLTVAAALAVVAVAVVVGIELRDRRAASPAATEEMNPSSAARVLGSSLGGIELGASADQVRHALREPARISDDGRQWIYTHGLIVVFDRPEGRVERIRALPGSIATTAEGFGGCCATLGNVDFFRIIYAAHQIDQWRAADDSDGSPSSPLQILSVTGLTSSGEVVTVRATFGGRWAPGVISGAESLDLFLGRPEGERLPVSARAVLDPAAVTACELLDAAASIVHARGLGGGELAPGGAVIRHPGTNWGAQVCAYAEDDDGWWDAHVLFFARPVNENDGSAEMILDSMLRSTDGVAPTLGGEFSEPFDENWLEFRPGRWIVSGSVSSPQCSVCDWVAIAVHAEPYLFVVTAADEQTADALADAVLTLVRQPR